MKNREKEYIHHFIQYLYSEKPEQVFKLMHKNIIWIEEKYKYAIKGLERIKEYILKEPCEYFKVWKENYKNICEDDFYCVVLAELLLTRNKENSILTISWMSMVWVNKKENPRLLYIHVTTKDLQIKEKRNEKIAEIIQEEKQKKRYEIKDRENNIYFLKDMDILYIECNRNYLIWHLRKEKITIRGTMAYYEQKLSEVFIRTHKSYLVNVNYVREIRHYFLKMANGDEIQIPAKKYTEVKGKILAQRCLSKKMMEGSQLAIEWKK